MGNIVIDQNKQVCMCCEELKALGVIQLPHSDELERAVLGGLIMDSMALYVTMDTLNKALFHNVAHQVIFEAIQTLFNNSMSVDILTVMNELRREGNLEQAGGAEYVSQLTDNIVSAAHIQTHIAILVEKHVQREVIRTAAGLLKDASDETCNPYMLLDKGVWSLEKIAEGIPQKKQVPLDDALSEVAKEIHTVWEQEILGIPSGFTSFDTITHGFQPGTLTVLASKPAMGKTSCALSMARNMALDFCFPVAFFSLQIKGTGLVARLISQEMGIPQSHLKNVSIITREKKRLIGEKIKELRGTPLFIDDADRICYTQLQSRCKKMVYNDGVRMIFIDGLSQIKISDENNTNLNHTKELYFISRKLKTLAQELNVPILITTSFDNRTDGHHGNISTLYNLQESGYINEVADIVISIQRAEQNEHNKSTEGKASLQILKNKEGELGVVDIRFDNNSMKFYDHGTPPKNNSRKNKKVSDTTVKKNHDESIDTTDLPF